MTHNARARTLNEEGEAHLLHEDLLYEYEVVEEVGGQAVLKLPDLRLRAQVRTL